MTTQRPAQRRGRTPARFFVAFALVALAIAGVLSYLASSSPDGLDSVTEQGCTVGRDSAGQDQLAGRCIAQHARDHAAAGSPLADYTVGGDGHLTGVAGMIGVVVTLAVAGGLFWLVRPRRAARQDPPDQA